MIYNFAGERKWITKHDGGDIGEFLRFSQYWVMFSSPPTKAEHVIFTGILRHHSTVGDSGDGGDVSRRRENDVKEVDVWRWISDGTFQTMDSEKRKHEIWYNMTEIYPSPRVERMFDQMVSRKRYEKIKYFMNKMCINSPFEELRFIIQHLTVMPPSEPGRFKMRKVTTLEESCKKDVS